MQRAMWAAREHPLPRRCPAPTLTVRTPTASSPTRFTLTSPHRIVTLVTAEPPALHCVLKNGACTPG